MESTLFSAVAQNRPRRASVTKSPFGITADGQAVDRYRLVNANGIEVDIINFGGVITALKTPDRHGRLADIVLGFDSVEEYAAEGPYLGAIIGRCANRLANGQFSLDGKSYQLATNRNPSHLHGGEVGFDKRVWKASPVQQQNAVGVALSLLSLDGEEGYPGNLQLDVVYRLDNDNRLSIDYRATTDAPTILNLTNHSYFNLAGAGVGDILNHTMQINANRFTPTDENSIPYGELRPVDGTPFDFRIPKAIGARINAPDEQIRFGKGYDHNFVLNHRAGELGFTARASEFSSGRVLTVYTTEPGVQFYTGNFLEGERGKDGRCYSHRSAFCLETQHFPDAPHHPHFPSTVLRPGQTYRQTTIWEFSTLR
jgi:aldose 1-epimerase